MKTERIAYKLSFSRKLLISVARLVALAVPVVFGLVYAAQIRAHAQTGDAKLPEFEVASVKAQNPSEEIINAFLAYPGGKVVAKGCTLQYLIMVAFDVEEFQISDGRSRINLSHDRYDIEAKPPATSQSVKSDPTNPKEPPSDEQRQMLQTLLMDRFQLKFHRESRRGPVYILSRGKGNLKLQNAQNKDEYRWAGDALGGMPIGRGLAGQNISMPLLAVRLSSWLKRPVLNQTGIKGSYDFQYIYAPEPSPEAVISSIFTSLKEIGLQLKSGKGSVETIVIDHIEQPSPN
jgi:uncharacterized protein (TIGR03435 family)